MGGLEEIKEPYGRKLVKGRDKLETNSNTPKKT